MKIHLQLVLIVLLSNIFQVAFFQNPTLITDPPGAKYCEGSAGVIFGIGDSDSVDEYTLQKVDCVL